MNERPLVTSTWTAFGYTTPAMTAESSFAVITRFTMAGWNLDEDASTRTHYVFRRGDERFDVGLVEQDDARASTAPGGNV